MAEPNGVVKKSSSQEGWGAKDSWDRQLAWIQLFLKLALAVLGWHSFCESFIVGFPAQKMKVAVTLQSPCRQHSKGTARH